MTENRDVLTLRRASMAKSKLLGTVLASLFVACGGDDGSEESTSLTGSAETEGQGTTGDSGDGDSGTDGDGSDDSDSGSGDVPVVQLESTYQVEVTELVYGSGLLHDGWGGAVTGTTELKLDLYEPIDAPGNRPAFVIVHGGGFVQGDKGSGQLVDFANYFAERGFVAVSINYRLAGEYGTVPQVWLDLVDMIAGGWQVDQANAMYPAGRDAKAALRWLHANADTHQINTNYVTAMGGSAGALLAVMLGVTDPEDYRDELTSAEDETLETTNLRAASDVHTIIDHWGSAGLVESLQILDGVNRFDATDAPISIVHGTADTTVPFSEGENLRSVYMGTGVPHAWYPLEGELHGPWQASYDGKNLHELAWDFVIEQQELTVE